jgi:hypothetical protein
MVFIFIYLYLQDENVVKNKDIHFLIVICEHKI